MPSRAKERGRNNFRNYASQLQARTYLEVIIKEPGNLADGESVPHRDRIHADKRGIIRFYGVSLDLYAAYWIGAVEHHDLLFVFSGGLKAERHRINKGVNPGPNVLKINNQHIYEVKHLFRGYPGFAVQTENRDFQEGICHVRRGDHVVLFFREKTVLRTEERLEPTRERFGNQITTVAQFSVN